jgi:hypothetical protein
MSAADALNGSVKAPVFWPVFTRSIDKVSRLKSGATSDR